MLLMGDFNFGQIDWESESVEGPEGSDHARFLETMQDLYLVQHVCSETRFRDGHMSSRLDLIFSNDENAIDVIDIGKPLAKSDHAVLTWDYHYNSHKGVKARNGLLNKLNFGKADFEEMKNTLQEIDWRFFDSLGIEAMWDAIKHVIEDDIRKHVPSHRKRTSRPAAPWWNAALTKEVKAKHKAFKAYCETKAEEDHRKYVTQRNKITSKIKEAKRKYESLIISNIKENPKIMNKYIRSKQKAKPTIQMLENGRVTQKMRVKQQRCCRDTLGQCL